MSFHYNLLNCKYIYWGLTKLCIKVSELQYTYLPKFYKHWKFHTYVHWGAGINKDNDPVDSHVKSRVRAGLQRTFKYIQNFL
jgi:hypothetical protein